MYKKIIIILSTIMILIYSTDLLFIKATAGAPKLIYEVVEGTTKSMIKAVEARKGFKVVEGGTGVAKSDDVVQMVGKSLQEGTEVAVKDAWTTIKGGKFNATPLKDMPGWMKVTIGTAAFLTSTDILLDIYNKFQTNPTGEFETLIPYKNADFYQSDSLLGWEVTTIWDGQYSQFQITYPDGTTYKTGGWNIDWFPKKLYIHVNPNNPNNANIYATHPSDANAYAIFQVGTNPRTQYFNTTIPNVEGLFKHYRNQNLWFFNNNGPVTDVPTNMGVVMPVKAPQFETYATPEIDTTKEMQTLIIPDPSYHPNLDEAINTNREMVSNPEQWLIDNPQHDPTPNGDGETVPGEEPIKEEDFPNLSCQRIKKPDFEPLTNAFTTSFPFSIPWDLHRAFISAFSDIGNERPEFDYKFKFNNKEYSWKIGFPQFFEGWIPFIRGLILLTFDVGLIYAIYRFTKGGGD